MFFLDFGLMMTLIQLLVELNSFFINLVETPIHTCALLHFYWRLSWGWKWKEFTLTHKMLSCLKNLELKKLNQVKKIVFSSKDNEIGWLTDSLLCWGWHVYFGVCVSVDMFIVMVREERVSLERGVMIVMIGHLIIITSHHYAGP